MGTGLPGNLHFRTLEFNRNIPLIVLSLSVTRL